MLKHNAHCSSSKRPFLAYFFPSYISVVVVGHAWRGAHTTVVPKFSIWQNHVMDVHVYQFSPPAVLGDLDIGSGPHSQPSSWHVDIRRISVAVSMTSCLVIFLGRAKQILTARSSDKIYLLLLLFETLLVPSFLHEQTALLHLFTLPILSLTMVKYSDDNVIFDRWGLKSNR